MNIGEEITWSKIKSVRQKGGLGESPLPFYINLSESLNRQLKRQVDHKKSGLIDFIDHMREFARLQESQVHKAIIRKGTWRFTEQFVDLEVPSDIWFTAYTKADKERRIDKVLSTDLTKVTLSTTPPLNEVPAPTCILPDPSDHRAPENATCTSLQSDSDISLSIPYSTLTGENIHIHANTLSSMWRKAAELVHNPSMVMKAPGSSSPFSRMVASAQSEAPHFVSVPKQFSGQFLCDSRCPMFGAYKICSHTLAAAETCGKL